MVIARAEDEIISFTLRLPKAIRDQLQAGSEAKNRSLNAYIQDVLESHLIESGFMGAGLVSQGGRIFEVQFQEDDIKDRFDLVGFFGLRELRFDKRRATYMIGLSKELTEDWNIKKDRGAESIKALGLAMMAFYNRTCEVDKLSWPHPYGDTSFDGFRLLTARDVMPINSAAEFLDRLRQNKWTDTDLQVKGESQDFRRGRREQDLYR